jgi:hypothetical protein
VQTQPPPKGRPRLVLLVIFVVIIVVAASLSFFIYSPSPPSKNDSAIGNALTYLAGNYDNKLGLISEYQGSNTFWLYSDNYLASLAFNGYSGVNSNFGTYASILRVTVGGYTASIPPSDFVNMYMVLNSSTVSPPFGCPESFTYTWADGAESPIPYSQYQAHLNVTLNDGSACPLSPSQYADAAFLEAIYYVKAGEMTQATSAFATGSNFYDGTGLNDSAYYNPQSSSAGVYQTYKLALFLYAANCMSQQSQVSALTAQLESLQDNSTGGFYTGYTSLASPVMSGVSQTNSETTALAALAIELTNGNTKC